MIGSLRGILAERNGGEVLIEVVGVGYRVTVTPATVVALGELGDEVFLHIHHHYREDLQTLYGFRTRDERMCFEALISAHGVGPALALAILGVHDPAGLQRVLATDDLAALCLVPGVGKKTAQRLLVELKERLDSPVVDLTAAHAVGTPGAANELNDVREALSGLGYGAEEIQSAMRDLPAEGDASELLREALQRLAAPQ